MAGGVAHYHGLCSRWKQVFRAEEGAGQAEDGATSQEEEKGGH